MISEFTDRGSSDDELEKAREELTKVRRELIATRIVAFGFILVSVLSLYGASRVVVHGALLAVMLVAVFLFSRWGLGDTELSLSQSIGLTLTVAAVYLLLMLWGGR